MTITNTRRNRQIIFQVIFVAGFILAILVLLWRLGAFQTIKSEHLIAYKVEGGGPLIITYLQPDGKVVTQQGVFPPWRSPDMVFPRGVDMIVTVANQAQIGAIRCNILVDNKVYVTDSTDAPGDKLTCSGKVP